MKDFTFWLLSINIDDNMFDGSYGFSIFTIFTGNCLFSRGRSLFAIDYRKNIDIVVSVCFVNFNVFTKKGVDYERD